jgi:hypothetical protein
MSKKVKKQLPKEVFGKNYIVKSGRNLPIYKCLISDGGGLISCLIIRRLPNGNFVVGGYMVDRFCLGLKSTNCKIDLSMDELEDYLDMMGANLGSMEECTYATVHNWIYGGIAYAEDLGFKPDKDFSLSKFMLEEDTEDVELIEFEFGSDGKPLFIEGPYDNANAILATLERNVGEGNYNFVSQY